MSNVPRAFHPSTVDPIIYALGKDLGRYQLLVCLFIFLVNFPTGWVALAVIFLNPYQHQTGYECADPEGAPACEGDCREWVFDTSVMEKSVTSEFLLNCDECYKNSVSQALVMLGIVIGSLVFAQVSDKYGRHPAMCWSCLLELLTGVGAAFAPEYYSFAILRFLVAAAVGGTMVTSIVIIVEIVGPKYRELMAVLFQIPFNLGHASLPLFAYFLRDWRYFQFAISIFAVVYMLYWCFLPESPRYLLVTGNTEEAIKILKRGARINGVPSDTIEQDIDAIYKALYIADSQRRRPTIADLYRTPYLRSTTLLMGYNWLAVCLTYYGMAEFIATFSGNIYFNVGLSAAVGVAGTCVCLAMTVYLGRRSTLVISNALSGVSLILLGFMITSSDRVQTVLASISLFGAAVSYPNVFLFGAELFPTVVRSLGMGVCSAVGHGGSIVAPFLIDLRIVYPGILSFACGLICVISIITTLFLPETNGMSLPELEEDSKNMAPQRSRRRTYSFVLSG